MRYLRALTIAAALTVGLLLPSGASAQINTFQLGTDAQLGPEGATVTVPVIINCDAGQFGFLSVTVAQSTGHRLAQGSVFSNIACTGPEQTLEAVVANFPGVNAYKKGRASASATITLSGPTGSFAADAGPQEIHISK